MPKAKTPPKAGPGIPDVSGLTTATTAAIMAASPAVAKAWSDIMAESGRFVSERLQKDLKAQQALLDCKTPAELVALQSEFVLQALQHYTNEAQRVSKIMIDAGEEISKDARQTWSRDYDDVPL